MAEREQEPGSVFRAARGALLALAAVAALAIVLGLIVAIAMLRLSGSETASEAPRPTPAGPAIKPVGPSAARPQPPGPKALVSVPATSEPAKVAADAAINASKPTPAPAAAPPPARAGLVRVDDHSAGGWVGQYGKLGYLVAMPGEPRGLPPRVSLRMNGGHLYIWSALTTDRRALSVPSQPARLSAGQWFDWDHFSIDLDLRDRRGDVQVALYLLDWDTDARAQRLEVADADTGAVLLTRTDDDFRNGRYVILRLAGHVVLRLTKTAGANCTLSGIFLDDVAPAP